MSRYVPVTPAGTPVFDIQAKTESKAWQNLLRATSHMPYGSVEALKKRGYTVEKWGK